MLEKVSKEAPTHSPRYGPSLPAAHLGHPASKPSDDHSHSQYLITIAQQTPSKSCLVKPFPNS